MKIPKRRKQTILPVFKEMLEMKSLMSQEELIFWKDKEFARWLGNIQILYIYYYMHSPEPTPECSLFGFWNQPKVVSKGEKKKIMESPKKSLRKSCFFQKNRLEETTLGCSDRKCQNIYPRYQFPEPYQPLQKRCISQSSLIKCPSLNETPSLQRHYSTAQIQKHKPLVKISYSSGFGNMEDRLNHFLGQNPQESRFQLSKLKVCRNVSFSDIQSCSDQEISIVYETHADRGKITKLI